MTLQDAAREYSKNYLATNEGIIAIHANYETNAICVWVGHKNDQIGLPNTYEGFQVVYQVRSRIIPA